MLGISLFFAALYFIGALAFFIFAYKISDRERTQMVYLGAVLLLGSMILAISGFRGNVRLLITGAVSPIGLFFVITSAFSLNSCRRCTYEVTAKCVGFQLIGRGAGTECCPRFKYCYNEENYEVDSLSAYKKREAKRLYQTGTEYTVYIDPDQPTNCVCDVKRLSARHVFIIIVNSAITLVGLAALVL